MDEQQQEQAAFEQAFAETAGIEAPAPTAASTDAVAGVDAPAGQQAEPAAPEASNAAQDSAEATGNTEGQSAQPEAPTAEDEDPVLLDGLKRSELRRLLGNAAEVEGLKRKLDKAHGSIGELNRRLQQAAPPAAAATPAQSAPELPPELKQFEEDFPEVAQYVRALGIQPQQQRQEAPPAEVQQPVATGDAPAAQAGPDPMALEMAVLDRMHSGWREKIGSQDFGLWLASQGEQAQTAFGTAETADAMGAVLGQFDQWATARTAAAGKAAKGQQRLQKATTPAGNAQRPQAAPTEIDAMEAAFKRTLGL